MNLEMLSPRTDVRFRASSQDHIQVRTSLQVVLNSWNCCEVVEDARWWGWRIVENLLTNKTASCLANVHGKDCSLWILGINREVCNSGPDLIELGRAVYDWPALTRG